MDLGKEDLAVAELIISHSPIMLNSACFHCQQAVEKFFKAFLVSKKVEFPKTHNLELLRLLCIKQDVGFAQYDVGDYENYAVRNRYPHDNEIPDFDQVKDMYSGACEILSFVEDIIF